jgi:hypothetical protein
MTRRRVGGLALIVAVAISCPFLAWSCFALPSVSGYHGDGTFLNLSRRAGPFAIPGYSISMPEFDLGHPHRAEYRVAGLANIGRKCGVYLALHDPGGRWGWGDTKALAGEVQLELRDSGLRTLVNVRGKLGDYIWYGFRDTHALYQMDRSFFVPDSREEYTVRVSYSPDPRLAGYEGFVYLECGGHL